MSLTLSLNDKPSCLGHQFVIGLSGPALTEDDRRILEELRPIGVLLRAPNFQENVEYSLWLSTLKSMLKETREICQREKIIICIDHEGGRVHRVPAPLTRFPDPCSYAAQAGKVAEAMAIELASIGVNLSLAPVADIHSNPANPVIGRRAYGTSAEAVTNAVLPFSAGLMRHGVLACAKHFPGHGDTSQDSHLELPRVRLSIDQLMERELKPFKALIDADIPMILTAHIKFLAIDRRNPATMSKRIMQEILRESLGFKGVIISDDLDMKAIAANYSEPDIATRTANAGMDLYLFNHEPKRGIKVANALLAGLKSKKIKEESLADSFERIRFLIENKLSMHAIKLLPSDVFQRHAKLAASCGNQN